MGAYRLTNLSCLQPNVCSQIFICVQYANWIRDPPTSSYTFTAQLFVACKTVTMLVL